MRVAVFVPLALVLACSDVLGSDVASDLGHVQDTAAPEDGAVVLVPDGEALDLMEEDTGDPPDAAAPPDAVLPSDLSESVEATVPTDAPEPTDTPEPSDTPEPTETEETAEAVEPTDLAEPDVPPTCPEGVICVDALPFEAVGNTDDDGVSSIDSYACKPGTDESGPEVVYRVAVPHAGFLSAVVLDDDGVDVDVHLLSAIDGEACLARGHHHAAADVEAGFVYVVVDSYVSGGTAQSGAYTLQIGLMVPSEGPCGMETGIMKRVGDGGDHLAMPASGPIVLEAHLVTQDEPPPYPMTATQELAEHYALSQAETGLVMFREQDWAPLEGGSHYGAGIGSPTLFPTLDEGWYVNMYWTAESRPPRGTRMIFRLAGTSRAVVVSAGYETGPGNLDHIGGTPEETHFYLGTGHLDEMTLGIATDQTLGLGPRTCTD